MTDRRSMENLARANEVRLRRAELRRKLKERKVKMSEILETELKWLQGEPVGRLLTWAPGIGPKKARKLVAQLNPWSSDIEGVRKVEHLTDRQFDVLLDELRQRGK